VFLGERLIELYRRMGQLEKDAKEREKEISEILTRAMRRGRPHNGFNYNQGLENMDGLLLLDIVNLKATIDRLETVLGIARQLRNEPEKYDPNQPEKGIMK
jgi:hypothetical protein